MQNQSIYESSVKQISHVCMLNLNSLHTKLLQSGVA